MKKLTILIMCFLIVGIFLPSTQGKAAEMNFAVEAVIPDNQVDKSQTYFDLHVEPKQKQALQVKLRNSTNKRVTVEMSANTATTNDNGIVEYNNKSKEKDSSLKIAFAEIASVPKEITLPAKSTKTVSVKLKVPEKAFDGVVLGGLHFTEKMDKKEKKNQKDSQIINKYAYTIGVVLQESDKVIKPHLKLNKVTPGQVNFRNVLQANIQNDRPAIITDMSLTGKIYKKGSDAVLYERKQQKLRMAPNSNFNFGISLNNEAFKPGTYTFKGTAKAGKQTWHFEKDFTIKGKEAGDLNKQAIELKKDYTWLYMTIGAGIVALLLGVIGFLIYQLRKRKQEEEK